MNYDPDLTKRDNMLLALLVAVMVIAIALAAFAGPLRGWAGIRV